jgi:hypothetical protein
MKFELIKEKASSLINTNFSKSKKLDGTVSNMSNLNLNINNSLMYTNSGGFNNDGKVKALNTSSSKIRRPSSATAREKGKKIIGLNTKPETVINSNINVSASTNAGGSSGFNISNEYLKDQFNAVLNKNNNLYNKFLEFLMKK